MHDSSGCQGLTQSFNFMAERISFFFRGEGEGRGMGEEKLGINRLISCHMRQVCDVVSLLTLSAAFLKQNNLRNLCT